MLYRLSGLSSNKSLISISAVDPDAQILGSCYETSKQNNGYTVLKSL